MTLPRFHGDAGVPEGLVVVRGGGDLASGAALRLWRIGFEVVILEEERPRAVRRTVSFSEAVYDGMARVEEAEAIRVDAPGAARDVAKRGKVAVLVDPDARWLGELRPDALVDAIMAKRNTGTRKEWAPRVIALGPGFEAPRDCHAVVETNRGPDIGRVIWRGAAEPNTGEPGEVGGQRGRRVLRAPAPGVLRATREIGDMVQRGEIVADVWGFPVRSELDGLLRGLLRDGTRVTAGMKIGDVDPRGDPSLTYRVSDKSLAVAGGVLEAVLSPLGGRLAQT
jgi:xanthine dehydrogenase accessory factor